MVYTGKPYDTVTGLYNYGYRDYSPQQARFTTVDPIRDGNNWFSYVVNDPVNYVDLWGLCTDTADDDGNKYEIGFSSSKSTHIGYAFVEGEGVGASFTTSTSTNITEKNGNYEVDVTVISISGPQIRHDDIVYFGDVSLNVDGIPVETKPLGQGNYIIASTSKFVGEASFTLPKEGDVSITISNLGYTYNNPEGRFFHLSNKKDKIDIKEL